MDDDSLDLDSLRREALRAMARVLRAPDAKPDTLLRAAEAIMRAEPIASGAVRGAQALDDDALLAIAKGVHPPEMGPTVPSAGSVPSDAPTIAPATPSAGPVTSGAHAVTSGEQTAEGGALDPPGLVRPAKGTQKGPVTPSAPGGPTSISQIAKRGPKTDPSIATPAPQLASQIKIDDTAPAPAPPSQPWE